MRLTANRLMVPGGNAFENYILNTINPTYYWKLNETAGALNGQPAIDYGTGGVNMAYYSPTESYLTDVTISDGPKGPGKRFDEDGGGTSYAQITSGSILPASITSISMGLIFRTEACTAAHTWLSFLSGAPVTNVRAQIGMGLAASTSAFGIGADFHNSGAQRSYRTSSNSVLASRVASQAWQHVCVVYRWGGVGDETDCDIFANGSQHTLVSMSTPVSSTLGLAAGHVNLFRGNVSPEGHPPWALDAAHVWVKTNFQLSLAQHQTLNTLLNGAI